jgi:hypothetical protein
MADHPKHAKEPLGPAKEGNFSSADWLASKGLHDVASQ